MKRKQYFTFSTGFFSLQAMGVKNVRIDISDRVKRDFIGTNKYGNQNY
jgi:hypothetical protein